MSTNHQLPAQYVHLVCWKEDGCMCIEAFANEADAQAYCAAKPGSWVNTMALRTSLQPTLPKSQVAA